MPVVIDIMVGPRSAEVSVRGEVRARLCPCTYIIKIEVEAPGYVKRTVVLDVTERDAGRVVTIRQRKSWLNVAAEFLKVLGKLLEVAKSLKDALDTL